MSNAAPTTATNPTPETPVEGYLKKAEVATRLNRSLKTVGNWMKRGILPYYKLGHRVSFRWSEIEAHWAANYRQCRRRVWGAATFGLKQDLSAFPPVKSGVALPCRRSKSRRRGQFPE